MSEGIKAADLEAAITSRLNATHTEISDISGGCGQAFDVVIVSPQFTGKNRLARHRLVNTALKQEIAAIHAFTQKNYTPEEWAKQAA
ncbi:bola protein [Dipodascopsis tothii]|uniref:bola protein n=1 Tax=Dipodascopsis tothii TaxID=44089 RepID=UPI0034CFC41B